MEDSGFCYAATEQRLLARFPFIPAGSSARRTLPRSALSLPEKP